MPPCFGEYNETAGECGKLTLGDEESSIGD